MKKLKIRKEFTLAEVLQTSKAKFAKHFCAIIFKLRAVKAFTLAEVLITLSIIGVVAVLTVPNVITSYQKKVVPIKLEKFYVEMNNALKLSQIYNGKAEYWTYPTNVEETEVFFNKYLVKYLRYTKTETSANGIYLSCKRRQSRIEV